MSLLLPAAELPLLLAAPLGIAGMRPLPPSCRLPGDPPIVCAPKMLGLLESPRTAPAPREENGKETENVRGFKGVRASFPVAELPMRTPSRGAGCGCAQKGLGKSIVSGESVGGVGMRPEMERAKYRGRRSAGAKARTQHKM